MDEQSVSQSPSQENDLTEIGPVLDKLRLIGPEIFQQRLDAKAKEIDPTVGIVIVPLFEQGSVIAGDGQEYKFYVARVEPGKHVNPHVHFKGEEPYRLITGEQGIMHLGTIEDKTVNWQAPALKRPGDEIIVKGGEVHSFENAGKVAADFTFACPDTHLNSTDRIMTADFQNGFPKYQK